MSTISLQQKHNLPSKLSNIKIQKQLNPVLHSSQKSLGSNLSSQKESWETHRTTSKQNQYVVKQLIKRKSQLPQIKEQSSNKSGFIRLEVNKIVREDEEFMEFYKYERGLVQNVGQWMDQNSIIIQCLQYIQENKNDQQQQPTVNKTDSLSKQMMKNLVEGNHGVQGEDFDQGKYSCPHINLNIINGNYNDTSLYADDQDENSQIDTIINHPSETQEMKKLHLNKKIINDVLLTKLIKQQENKGELHQEYLEQTTQDALSSFKNLVTIVPHISSVINYSEVCRKLLERKQIPEKLINPIQEKNKNWEKLQKLFDQIVQSLTNKIETCIEEIHCKKDEVVNIRQINFDIHKGLRTFNDYVDQVQKRFNKKISQISQQLNDKDSQPLIRNIREQKEEEVMQIISKIQGQKQKILKNKEIIIQLDTQILRTKKQKDHIKEELVLFLKAILKNDSIYLNNSLTQVVKFLINLKVTLQSVDFASYLDEESKNFLLQHAQLEIKQSNLKKTAQQDNHHQRANTISQQDNIFGNRQQYESKLKEMQKQMNEYKKENSHSQKQTLTNNNQQTLSHNTNHKDVQVASVVSELQELKSKEKPLDINSFKENLTRINEIEAKLRTLENEEVIINNNKNKQIQRLKQSYGHKANLQSVQVRIYKLVQALFGRKNMQDPLYQVFGPQSLLTLNQMFLQQEDEQTQKQQETKKQDLKQHIKDAESNLKNIQNKMQQKNEVQYQFDLLENFTKNFKSLQRDEIIEIDNQQRGSTQQTQRVKFLNVN